METGRGARFFSEDERVLIGDLLRAGQSVRSIAVRLGRSPPTISREVRRNRSEAGNYRPFTVHRSPFTVHRSPFTVHRSPFTVHRSPFTAWRWPGGLGQGRENWPTTSLCAISC